MDPLWCDDHVWVDTEDGLTEVDPSKDLDNTGDNVVKTGYVDVWEVLTVAFTEEGCKEHLRLNGHNYQHYQKVDIFVDSLYRCPEMQAIRNFLLDYVPRVKTDL